VSTKPGPRDGGSRSPDAAQPLNVDPEAAGPFEVDDATGTEDGVAMHAFFPKTDGKQPVIVFAHGFQLPPSQYEKPLKHLASYGYVALTADFEASFTGSDNDEQAKQILAGLDWAAKDGSVSARSDVDHAGMSGHSLGGKLALLAATKDKRVKASIVLDPVDGNGVTVANLLPDLEIPTAFLGETLDGSGGLQPCAPKNANYATFFAKATSPSLEITVKGASHMSFIDDLGRCGVACNFCKKATADAGDVAQLTRGYLVAFYERHLRGKTEYDAYLRRSTDLAAVKSK
jgi:dienelactone hydrolase